MSTSAVALAEARKTAAESAPVSFTADTATKTALSERTIQQSIHRAENIAPEVRDPIRDIPEIADKGVELDALAKMSPERQATVVAMVESGDAANIRAAAAYKLPTDAAGATTQKGPKPNPRTTEPPFPVRALKVPS
jgi:hypothetical protein